MYNVHTSIMFIQTKLPRWAYVSLVPAELGTRHILFDIMSFYQCFTPQLTVFFNLFPATLPFCIICQIFFLNIFFIGLRPLSFLCVYHIYIGIVVSGTLATGNLTIGPSQATPSLLIGVVLSSSPDMWGVVTNTSYNGTPTSLGIVPTLIHCLR